MALYERVRPAMLSRHAPGKHRGSTAAELAQQTSPPFRPIIRRFSGQLRARFGAAHSPTATIAVRPVRHGSP